MDKYSLVIVDDEIDSQITLKSFLQEYCPNIELTGSYSNVQNGVQHILQCEPDILLLDINLSDGTGFDVLNAIAQLKTRVIFITAYEQHAVEAFKYQVDNYLLKPLHPEHLKKAVEGSIKKINTVKKISNLQLLVDSTNVKKLGIPTKDTLHIMELNDIIRCEANGNYTYIYVKDQERIIVPKTMKKFEEILSDHSFIRTHQSHLVNQQYIKKILLKENLLDLNNGDQIAISRKYKPSIISFYKLKII